MDLVATYAAKHPHRPALIEGERSLTWEQFFRARNRLAHSLGALGVPMSHRLTAEEAAYILDNSDATAVFVGDAFLPMAERVRDGARVKHWITLGAERRPWAAAFDELLA